ncbi:MAG: type II 3-dehydroquinate dehydratase [Helicobacter sp.]|nr:type II 3-dehydroquinate dehydratase [Helicobacter sp.]MCI7485276.1 type II 3-dehydroquinate dehydratase [Helicobacter sp.]MDD7567753.1 type II 3-dehydroquinate dehydratase [Helicobacter sp.]MDY5740883.1 type II 3-dehydroquinate dehydratase [Helicobacter sp.]
MKILVIQGPNLNVLGHREPHIYGNVTLEQIHENLKSQAQQNNMEIEFFQTNFEGEIIDKLQECIGGEYAGVLINPAAYSHTSVAIADAIASCGVPVVEVHISNIHAREDFRAKSITGRVCAGVIAGFGAFGYHLGLIALFQILNELALLKQQEEQNKQ